MKVFVWFGVLYLALLVAQFAETRGFEIEWLIPVLLLLLGIFQGRNGIESERAGASEKTKGRSDGSRQFEPAAPGKGARAIQPR